MKKGFLLKLVSLILVFVLLVPSFSEIKAAESKDKSAEVQWTIVNSEKVVDKIEAAKFSVEDGKGAKLTNDGVFLPVDGSVDFTINVPSTSNYNLILEYRIDTDKVLKNTISLSWDKQEALISVPALWRDSNKNYEKDRYGNDIIPDQKMLKDMHLEYAKGYASLDKSPLILKLEKGSHKFTIKNNTQPMVLKCIYVVEENIAPSYEEYSRMLSEKSSGDKTLTIEAEDYKIKSDSFIRIANEQNPALYPYSTNEKRLNIIDGTSWKEAGQKIIWEFDVEASGMYSIGFRYSQNKKEGMSVFRNIEIDGELAFKEMGKYPFKYTGTGYKNSVVSDKSGKTLRIWLDKGKHTIAMEVDAAPINAVSDKLKEVMLNVNATGINIKKLTGGNKDANRTWDIVQYIPDIVQKLESWANSLDESYEQLKEISGSNPSFAVNLNVAANNLRDIAKEPEKIPSQLTKLSEGSGSVAQLVGDLTLKLSEQPLNLDRIYILGDEEIPSVKVGIFSNLLEDGKRFFSSFLSKNRGYGVNSKGNDELTVWVNRPIQYVELLQQLADTDFTPKSGIRVKFSVMPNEQKLTLSNASRKNPDVALGISNHIPYQLAMRGAIADLTEFKDFLPYISQEYNLETLIPFDIDGKIYGVTETQEFYVLMYRKDILDKLKLSVPQTWDDVKNMMPELQRYSMNFFVPMAGWQGLKPFYTTVPFLFQNNSSLYSRDGHNTTINSEESIKGFELMTDLFNIYSISQNVPNFYNNFRYATMPIGVSNFSTYVMLMNAAPEISGMWDIALSPGVKDNNGKINRYQVACDKADIIFSNSSKKEQGWEMLKWWLSKETQIKYAYSLQTKYGPEYMWNTANIAAFEELPIPEKDKKVILEQWKNIKEIPPHPGSYMVEREISNAWTDIVMNGANTRVAIDKAALVANREILRKLEEFGYVKDGKIIREYNIPSVEDIRRKVKDSK